MAPPWAESTSPHRTCTAAIRASAPSPIRALPTHTCIRRRWLHIQTFPRDTRPESWSLGNRAIRECLGGGL